MTNADVTLQQLGGKNRLSVMIGATEFFSENEGKTLRFKFKMCSKANLIRITLDPSDTYTVEFIKQGRLSRKTFTVKSSTVKVVDGVYNDMLRDVFENFTGLYLSL